MKEHITYNKIYEVLDYINKKWELEAHDIIAAGFKLKWAKNLGRYKEYINILSRLWYIEHWNARWWLWYYITDKWYYFHQNYKSSLWRKLEYSYKDSTFVWSLLLWFLWWLVSYSIIRIIETLLPKI